MVKMPLKDHSFVLVMHERDVACYLPQDMSYDFSTPACRMKAKAVQLASIQSQSEYIGSVHESSQATPEDEADAVGLVVAAGGGVDFGW